MAVFIEVETDPFRTELLVQAWEMQSGQWNQSVAVRRPMRGLQIREPTYSYIRIVDRFGKSFPLMDSGAVADLPKAHAVSNYLLQQLVLTRAERFQVIPTFGDNYVFVYGEQPIQASIVGSLIEAANFTWTTEFWQNYDSLLRASKLADRQARMYLYAKGMIIEGICVGFNNTHIADQPHLVPFNLNVLVTNITYVNWPSVRFPIRRQQVRFLQAYDEAVADLDSRVETTEQAQESADQAFGSRAEYLQRAANARARALENNEEVIGEGWEAAQEGPYSPLVHHGLVTEAELERLNAQHTTQSTPQPPLRGLIQENIDEYLVRPSRLTRFLEDFQDEGSVDTGEGAEDAGVHEGEPFEDKEPVDIPFDAPWPAPPTGEEGGEPTVSQMVGYDDPAADPTSGSGMLTGTMT